MLRIKIAVFSLLVSCLAVVAASAEPLRLTLAGASPSGLWSLIGAGVDRAMKASDAGSTVTYQTSGGGFANIKLLQQGVVDMAMLHDAEATKAVNGEQPFDAPVTGLRALAVMYDFSALQPLISREFMDKYGIASFEDMKTKKPPIRVALNKKGNITHDLGANVLLAYGITLQDIENWGGAIFIAGSAEAADLMRDRRVDLTLNAPFVGHSSILEVATAIPVQLLPLSESVITTVQKQMGIGRMTIPAGAYEWSDSDIPTLTLSAMIAVSETLPAERAEEITRNLIVNIDELRNVHKAMTALNAKMLTAQSAIPFHPGAIAAYKEAGLM